MYLVLRPKLNSSFIIKKENILWEFHSISAIIIFVITAIAWIFSTKISAYFGGIDDMDSIIAIAAIVAIGITNTASWEQIQKNTERGALLLFGGGLALSVILKDSGASAIMTNGMALSFGESAWLIIIIAVATFIIFLTEFTSNTASAALLVPLFASVGEAIGRTSSLLCLVIGFGASCSFMLPVATQPNAIVFGSSYIRQTEMVKVGIFLNILSIALVSIFAWFVWRFVYLDDSINPPPSTISSLYITRACPFATPYTSSRGVAVMMLSSILICALMLFERYLILIS